MVEYYILSTKCSIQERKTKKNGIVYDVVFRVITTDGREVQKRLSGYRTKKAAREAHVRFVTEKCTVAESNPAKAIMTQREEDDPTVASLLPQYILSLNNQNINLIWGMYEDNSLDEEAKITIIATGFDRAVAEMSDLSSSQEEEDRKIDELIRQYYAVPQKGKEAAAEVKASEREEPDAGEEQVVETPPMAERKSIVQSIKDWINQFVSA